jgi:hypothetical protein
VTRRALDDHNPLGNSDNKEPTLELRIDKSQWGATENPMGIRTNNPHAAAAKHQKPNGYTNKQPARRRREEPKTQWVQEPSTRASPQTKKRTEGQQKKDVVRCGDRGRSRNK